MSSVHFVLDGESETVCGMPKHICRYTSGRAEVTCKRCIRILDFAVIIE
jgi:hypothetical protein